MQAHWLGVYHADYRKLKNQARFVREIMDNDFVVSRKKKQVVVGELREQKYEAFPKNADAKKTKAEEDEADAEGDADGAEDADEDTGTRDYDYLLSVSRNNISIRCRTNKTQMPIWSFTQERLDKLKEQIVKKKLEHDELEALSEKDLWVHDLDEFEAEWENQLRLDAEITTTIRRMGRRVSKKIGAGGKGRKGRDDDDYAPVAKIKGGAKQTLSKAAAPKPTVVEKKTQASFAAKFTGKTEKRTSNADGADEDSDPFSDDDYAALKSNHTKKAPPPAAPAAVAATAAPVDVNVDVDVDDSDLSEAPAPANARTKRAAAAKAKTWVVDDDDDDSEDFNDDIDVGDLVKGIPGGSADKGDGKTGRLSLFAMARPESSHGNAATHKTVKPKPSKTFDFDSHDDTNYEMLAKSSPHKTVTRNEIDDFLSDDDLPAAPKAASKPKASSGSSSEESKPAPAPAVKKARGRPAGAKSKDKGDDALGPAVKAPAVKKKAVAAAKPKPVQLSPAAKLYAKKKDTEKVKPKKDVFDMDDDDDDDIVMADLPVAKPAARGRPGRAAAVKKKPVYVLSDEEDEEDDSVEIEEPAGHDETDPFDMDLSD